MWTENEERRKTLRLSRLKGREGATWGNGVCAWGGERARKTREGGFWTVKLPNKKTAAVDSIRST